MVYQDTSQTYTSIFLVGSKYDKHYLCPTMAQALRTVGGTLNRDPCSLWGLIWGHSRDIGVI